MSSESLHQCVLLLTYKGKVLLLSKGNKLEILPYNPWSFIEKQKGKNTSEKDTIIQEVLKHMKIKLSEIDVISQPHLPNSFESVYHATLTDLNVNAIEREENSLLQFYSLIEVEKLNLQESTRQILTKYKSVLKNLLN